MNANLASIMPQAVAVWCEEAGHDVTFICYTGFEPLPPKLSHKLDVVFIGAFSQAAQLAYALSAMFRSQGAVTVLGGPHARCYPEDARLYFDYVLGFSDRETIRSVLDDGRPHRPVGLHLQAKSQPAQLPGVRDRWKFIEPTLAKAPAIKIVPMLASLGCPYTCSFCIDASVPYQALDFDQIKDDLRFLLTKFRRPRVAWHDPNFGVRFDDIMDAIEEAVPANRIDFIAESSLSLLSEAHLERLARNGFKAALPGIESWYELGNKSKTGKHQGMEKVRRVAEHINAVQRHIPYIQTNFVLGLDCDEGSEPFELTKRFLDLAPGAFPAYSLLSAFGRAAPLNLDYQRAGRVLAFPFHFLNNNHAMNVKPANYEWPDFYEQVISLTKYTFSWRNIYRRWRAIKATIPRWMNVVRGVSSEGFGRIRYYTEVRRRLLEDTGFRAFFERDTDVLPQFFLDRLRRDLGPLWEWLPEGAIHHDPNAYLKSQATATITPLRRAGRAAAAGA
ncbi:MAG TPA: radical SAM protein [Gemmatimonadales bacterium]|nr:radical SAM protein [Gemmatimonadales bacterium]